MPHQCAHWLAMTGFGECDGRTGESAPAQGKRCDAGAGGGTHGCRPTGDKRGCGGSGGVGPRPYGVTGGLCVRVVEDAVPYGGDKKGGRIATALCASQ